MSRKIPRNEADFLSAAQKIISGLKTNPDVFNDPSIDYKSLEKLAEDFKAARDEVMQKQASYRKSVMIKQDVFKKFYKNVLYAARSCIRIAENNKAVLSKVGLKQGRKTPEPPGQCLDLTIAKQEIKSVTLKWKKPKIGGVAKTYIIQRQEADADSDNWKTIWTEFKKQVKIKNQQEGKIFNYRVRAANALGFGLPSNTVTVKF